MDWQPIETAPKDGTEVLLWCPYYDPRIVVASWTVWDVIGEDNEPCRQEGGWMYAEETLADTYPEGPEPTYWMLPEPPQ